MGELEELRSLMEQEEERLCRLAVGVARWADGVLSHWPQPDVQEFLVGDPWLFLLRASVSRQAESLRISSAVFSQTGQAHLLGAFVRKSFEELVWLKYLRTLPVDQRRKVVHAFAAFELGFLARGQLQSLGGKQMKKIGFEAKFIDALAARGKESREELAEEAVNLGWAEDGDGKFTPPSVATLARSVGLSSEYQDVYDSSSRSVHFSISESLRRGSVSDNGVTIFDQSLSTFEQNCFVIDRQMAMISKLVMYAHEEVRGLELNVRERPRRDGQLFYNPGKVPYLNVWDFRKLEP
ncbi:DUF5677 domain-containing protein [Kitasatospora sp. NPDC058218]|uniref:DUF5677 domain-containing protein n=1 Tax=Kitasatospora sp. NPDC058218 TaxID=3346385 RepID=UPI0036D9F98D